MRDHVKRNSGADNMARRRTQAIAERSDEAIVAAARLREVVRDPLDRDDLTDAIEMLRRINRRAYRQITADSIGLRSAA